MKLDMKGELPENPRLHDDTFQKELEKACKKPGVSDAIVALAACDLSLLHIVRAIGDARKIYVEMKNDLAKKVLDESIKAASKMFREAAEHESNEGAQNET